MFWFIFLTLIAICIVGVGNTFKALFILGMLALVASAIYLGGFMAIVALMGA